MRNLNIDLSKEKRLKLSSSEQLIIAMEPLYKRITGQ